MVSAVILLKVERSHIKPLAERLAEFREISEVWSVAGSYDVVAVARVGKNEDLAELVTERLVKLHGIVASETLIAFRSYAHKDVEAGFQLGGT